MNLSNGSKSHYSRERREALINQGKNILTNVFYFLECYLVARGHPFKGLRDLLTKNIDVFVPFMEQMMDSWCPDENVQRIFELIREILALYSHNTIMNMTSSIFTGGNRE